MNFDTIFPNFVQRCTDLFNLLLYPAFVLVLAGFIGGVRNRGFTPIAHAVVTTATVILVMANWSLFVNTTQQAMQSVITELDVDPKNTGDKYIQMLATKKPPAAAKSKGLFGLPDARMMWEAFIWAIFFVVGWIAAALMSFAYLIQKFILSLAYAFAPIFLGLLSLRSTRSIGTSYILNTVGVLAWPLGWAAAAIATENFMGLATQQGFIIGGIVDTYSLQTILATAIIGLWIIITTLLAPVVIHKALMAGGLVGGSLLSGFVSPATAAGAQSVRGGVSGAMLGAAGGPLGVAAGATAGAGLAGGSSLLGSAMQGGNAYPSGALAAYPPTLPSFGSRGSSEESGEATSEKPPDPGADEQGDGPGEPPAPSSGDGTDTPPVAGSSRKTKPAASGTSVPPTHPASAMSNDPTLDRTAQAQLNNKAIAESTNY